MKTEQPNCNENASIFEQTLAAFRENPPKDPMKGKDFAFFSGEPKDPNTKYIIQRFAMSLLQIGETHNFSNMAATDITVSDTLNKRKMDAVLSFDPKSKTITLAGNFDSVATDGGHGVCEFSLKLDGTSDAGIFGSMGESDKNESGFQKFPVDGQIPIPMFSIMTAMVKSVLVADAENKLLPK